MPFDLGDVLDTEEAQAGRYGATTVVGGGPGIFALFWYHATALWKAPFRAGVTPFDAMLGIAFALVLLFLWRRLVERVIE